MSTTFCVEISTERPTDSSCHCCRSYIYIIRRLCRSCVQQLVTRCHYVHVTGSRRLTVLFVCDSDMNYSDMNFCFLLSPALELFKTRGTLTLILVCNNNNNNNNNNYYYYYYCFATAGPTLWNSLSEHPWQPDITLGLFKRSLKTFMFG